MTRWDDFRGVRALHESLHAVKVCRNCKRTMPISAFYVPNISNYRGWPWCKECIGWPSRQQVAS